MKPSVSVLFKSLFTCALFFIFFSCEKSNTPTNRGNGGGNNGSTPTDVQVTNNLQYGSNKDILGNNVNLTLDVYKPAGATSSQKFPFVLFVHGGGFIGGDKSSAASAMDSLAEAGFVAASIDYRLDSSVDVATDPCGVDTVTSEKTIYMSVQDARAAMRYMIANADKYNIDTTKIFFDGNSAGAVTVMNSYFLNQSDFNAIIPGVQNELGGINNADNNLTNSYKITAIACNSGCLPNPNYITASNAIPVIFFQGGEDSVIPVEQGHAYYCSNTLYVYGSITLNKRLISLGVPTVIHIDPTGAHGPYTQDFLTNNEICFFNSVLSKKTESGSYSGQATSCQ